MHIQYSHLLVTVHRLVNGGIFCMKLIKIIAYPWLAFGVKRLVKTGLNWFCVVLQLSKFQ